MKSAVQQQQIFWEGDTLWNLYGELKDRLFDNNGFRLDQWLRQGRATLVKSGAGRTIYHVRLPDLDIYVKHFRVTNALNLLHQLIRQGRAEKEFRLANLLHSCGVDTIKPIALGERWRHGILLESYLLSEAIPRGITLYELIERWVRTGRMDFPPKLRFHFAEELAKLAATIHDTGIEHRDLHERNIVAQTMDDGFYRFFILDLHELQIHQPLDWSRAQKELGRMGRYFTLRTSAADRLRFFKKYAEFRGFDVEETRKLARDVEKYTMDSRADFWRRRDTRSPRKSTRIVEYRSRGAFAYAAQDIPEETIRQLMANPAEPFEKSVVHWWKIGRGTRVAEVELPAIRRGDSLVYKEYAFKGWHESFAALFRQNQATRAWNYGGSLLLRELPTPQPLVLIQTMRFGLPHTSYLLTERVPNAQTITRYLDRQMPDLCPAERKRVLLGVMTKAARLLRTMHDRRTTHRDLKASNILVSPTDDPADPQLWLIDLDGVQTWLEVPEHNLIQNLTRFYVSFHKSPWVTLSDRVRFLRTYLGRDFRDKKIWKSFWRKIRDKAERKIQRNLRHGRSLV